MLAIKKLSVYPTSMPFSWFNNNNNNNIYPISNVYKHTSLVNCTQYGCII